jgi:hypothetical protein
VGLDGGDIRALLTTSGVSALVQHHTLEEDNKKLRVESANTAFFTRLLVLILSNLFGGVNAFNSQ